MDGIGQAPLQGPTTCQVMSGFFFLVLLTSVPGHSLSIPNLVIILLKKSTITISNAFNTQLFIKNLPFKVLKECPGALVNIFLFLNREGLSFFKILFKLKGHATCHLKSILILLGRPI
jgi:hypothetical protein